MENKYRAVKNFIRSSQILIKEIELNRFNIEIAAEIKGSLKLLDEGDYQNFSRFIEIQDNCEKHCKVKMFLVEKISSYRNYDFWPQDERIKQAEYKRQRNKLILNTINNLIEMLIRFRNFFGG